MKALFKICYDNGSEDYGNLFKGDWKKIPDYPIKSVVFAFLNKKIKLENFQAYNILVERSQSFSSSERISSITFVGRRDNTSNLFTFNLDTRQLKHIIKTRGMEFDGMLVRGWKNGIEGEEPKIWTNK